jgi:hypothetical protein
MTERRNFTINGPADVAGVVPYLLSFHPKDSLAFVILQGDDINFVGCAPLSDLADPRHVTRLTAILTRHRTRRVILVGYGDERAVSEIVEPTITGLGTADISVVDVIRIADGRIWHPRCTDPDCHVDGAVFDPATTVAAVQATIMGLVAWPDRQSLAGLITPVTGSERTAMTRALHQADYTLRRLTAKPEAHRRLRRRFDTLLDEALAAPSAGRPTAGRTAQLLLLLDSSELLDRATATVTGDDQHIRALVDLVRRADDTCVAGPAVLLCLAALQAGNGPLAQIAVGRARTADPHHGLAETLEGIVRLGIEPELIRNILHGHS